MHLQLFAKHKQAEEKLALTRSHRKTDMQYEDGIVSERLLASHTLTDPLQEFMLSHIPRHDK